MSTFSKQLLPISEAAQYLGVNATTLRRWHENGSFKATFVSPGGHRYYSISDLERRTKGIYRTAQEWVRATNPLAPPEDFYCSTSDRFKTRNEKMAILMETLPHLKERGPLIASVAGEIGNNSFDHNLGNWPDVVGAFFGYDLGKRVVVLADRGLGVLTTLKQIKPALQTDAEALKVAFTEYVTGRAPQHRGNGLKYVLDAIRAAEAGLIFQSGNAVLTVRKGDKAFNITQSDEPIHGCLSLIEF